MSLDPRLSSNRPTSEPLRRIVAEPHVTSRKSHLSDADQTPELPMERLALQINNGKPRPSSSPRSYPHTWKLLIPLLIGICIGATLVIFLHETPKARRIFHPLHGQYTRHLSHYHSGITGEGREEMLSDDETDPMARAEFEARILNETESVCGQMMVTHNQWYVLNHALHPEAVSEAEARDTANRTGFPIRKFGEAVSFLRWWGNAYYHGALQVLPFVNVMAKRLKNDLHHLTYLSTIPRSQESITSWLGFNRSLSVSWPPAAFYVEKLYHIDMIQKVNVGNLNMDCITSFRAELWRQFAHPHHYNPDNQYIVLANRLGTRSITNFDALVNHLRKQFPNEKFIRQYGDERMEDIRDVYMGAKAVIYPHGANSANIHLFAPPHRQFTSRFHIGNAAHRLYPCLIIEITWMEMDGKIWRNVEWELGQAGHEYQNIRINASQVLLPTSSTKKPISNLDEFLQNSNFYLEKEHMDEITLKLKNYLKARSDNPDYQQPQALE